MGDLDSGLAVAEQIAKSGLLACLLEEERGYQWHTFQPNLVYLSFICKSFFPPLLLEVCLSSRLKLISVPNLFEEKKLLFSHFS